MKDKKKSVLKVYLYTEKKKINDRDLWRRITNLRIGPFVWDDRRSQQEFHQGTVKKN